MRVAIDRVFIGRKTFGCDL